MSVRLLFVCTGNICRSAAADRLAGFWFPSSEVRSAGTRARSGRVMHPWTEAALERHGVNGYGFSSSRLAPEDVDWADLVLTMTAEHRAEVLRVNPRGLRKVFTLGEAAALCRGLPPGSLAGGGGGNNSPAAVIGRRRSHRSGRLARDIPDPIDESATFHVGVVDAIASELSALREILGGRRDTDVATVRMPRIPPVPPR